MQRCKHRPIFLGREVDQAWLAGLLIGEGTIYLWRTERHLGTRTRIDGPYPAFTIEMTDLEVIERVSCLVGTAAMRVIRKARKPPQYSPTFSVRAVGGRAIAVLECILSYLYGEKKVQAERMIREFSWMFSESNMARLPRNLRSFYESLRAENFLVKVQGESSN